MAEVTGLFRVPEPEIDPADPFSDDVLERKACAENLTRFLDGSPGGFALSVSSPWGSGKTFFIRRWRVMLETAGHKTVLLNAWADDYVEQPLVAIIDSIATQISEKSSERIEQLKKSVGKLLRIGGRFAVHYLTRGAIDVAAGQESDASEAAANIVAATVDDALKAQTELRRTVSAFRQQLEDFASDISELGKPLIILVDELDRARPAYAIDFLESIKHLCDVEGVVFVLAVDYGQILRTVDTMFGCGGQSDAYLRRFIDYSFGLPEPKIDSFCRALVKRCDLPVGKENAFGEYIEDVWTSFLPEISVVFSLQLRHVAQFAMRIATLAQMSTQGHWFYYSDSLLILCALQEHNPETYRQLVCGINHEPISAIELWAKNHPRPDALKSQSISRFMGELLALLIGEKVASVSSGVKQLFDQAEFDRGYDSVKAHHGYLESDQQARNYLRNCVELTKPLENAS